MAYGPICCPVGSLNDKHEAFGIEEPCCPDRHRVRIAVVTAAVYSGWKGAYRMVREASSISLYDSIPESVAISSGERI